MGIYDYTFYVTRYIMYICTLFFFVAIKFLSSGREDVDVRNIHSGRPFAVELINPRITKITSELLSNLVTIINDSSTQVKVTTNLKLLTR